MPLTAKNSKHLFLIIALLSFAFANEFIIESFKALPSDMAGSVYAKKDGNNEFCGLIKVKTGIREELAFDSGLKFSPSEKKNPGEYWIYVSPGEGRLTLMAEGFIPKHFQITTEKIESKRTYEMVVRAKEEEKIPVVILTDPPDAEKWLGGELLGNGDNYKIASGKYTLTVKKQEYYDYQTDITVANDNTLFKDIKLVRIEKEKISIISKPERADIYIDGVFHGRTNMEIYLFPGKYDLMLSKEGYVQKTQILELIEGKPQALELYLDRKTSSLQVSISPMEAACRLIENREEVRRWTGANYLQNIPVGVYELVCICDGYKTENLDISIKENEIQSIIINMEEGVSITTPECHIEEVYVKGGSFLIGNTWGGGDNDEKPVHTVTLSSFYIGKYEVTQALYREIIWDNPSRFTDDDLPVEQVTWYEAIKFCNKLSEVNGLQKVYTIRGKKVTADYSKNGYRLPTEAEWEYAARSGGRNDRKWSGTNNEFELGSYAWYTKNSGSKTHPVGTKQPNDLGIYDMSGNVWEWCWDRKCAYPPFSQTNPTGSVKGVRCVQRGGGWFSRSNYCRTSKRYYRFPSNSDYSHGFRLARNGD